VTAQVSIDVSDVQAASAALDLADDLIAAAADAEIREMAAATLAAVRRAGARHRASGLMDRRIRADVDGTGLGTHARVVAAGPIAAIITAGQAPHTIAAIRPHALAIGGAGSVRAFATRVRHPGTSPDPFVKHGIQAAVPTIDRDLDQAATRLVDQLADRIDAAD
jgi:hypothetical protein